MTESSKYIQDLAHFFFNNEHPHSLLNAQNLVGEKHLRSAVADCIMLLNYIFNLNQKKHYILLEDNESSKALQVLVNNSKAFKEIFEIDHNKIVLNKSLMPDNLSEIRKIVNEEIQIKVLQKLDSDESKISGKIASTIMRFTEKFLP